MGPLAGIWVADLSRVLAGAFCSLVPEDLEADVIKGEPPTGDVALRLGVARRG